MKTSMEKLKIIAELKKRVDEIMVEKPEHEFIDLCEVLEEVEEYPEYVD